MGASSKPDSLLLLLALSVDMSEDTEQSPSRKKCTMDASQALFAMATEWRTPIRVELIRADSAMQKKAKNVQSPQVAVPPRSPERMATHTMRLATPKMHWSLDCHASALQLATFPTPGRFSNQPSASMRW